jgi:hypothetical protein
MFDLGGAHWNSGDTAITAEMRTAAKEPFPDHELSAKLKRDFPGLFSDAAGGRLSLRIARLAALDIVSCF